MTDTSSSGRCALEQKDGCSATMTSPAPGRGLVPPGPPPARPRRHRQPESLTQASFPQLPLPIGARGPAEEDAKTCEGRDTGDPGEQPPAPPVCGRPALPHKRGTEETPALVLLAWSTFPQPRGPQHSWYTRLPQR